MKKLTKLQEEYKTLVVDPLIKWIQTQLLDTKAIIGISGGKDSSICAALCCEAIGKENVIGILMPNGEQKDIADSKKLVQHLGIKNFIFNIGSIYDTMITNLSDVIEVKDNVMTNIPPRLRMTVLYAYAAAFHGRVICTSNASEAFVGWTTKWGDNVGDLAPILNFTKTEVNAIGSCLDLPEELVFKTPADGLCGKSDEEKLGFTYEQLDKSLAYSEYKSGNELLFKVLHRHHISEHKREPIPAFEPKYVGITQDMPFYEKFFKE